MRTLLLSAFLCAAIGGWKRPIAVRIARERSRRRIEEKESGLQHTRCNPLAFVS
jgi:hypothetical protein